MADENVVFDLEINQTGNARQALREMAEASRTAARAGTDATNELTRAEVLYQSQLRQRGGILTTLANQQRSDRSAFGEAQGRQRDNGAGVLYSGGVILGGQRSGYDEARPRVQAEVVMPKIPALRVQVEQPVIPPLIVKQQVQVQYTAAAQAQTVRATPGDVMGLIGQLQHFGHGGVVTRPTVAVIGENGPEAVVPLAEWGRLPRLEQGGEFDFKRKLPKAPSALFDPETGSIDPATRYKVGRENLTVRELAAFRAYDPTSVPKMVRMNKARMRSFTVRQQHRLLSETDRPMEEFVDLESMNRVELDFAHLMGVPYTKGELKDRRATARLFKKEDTKQGLIEQLIALKEESAGLAASSGPYANVYGRQLKLEAQIRQLNMQLADFPHGANFHLARGGMLPRLASGAVWPGIPELPFSESALSTPHILTGQFHGGHTDDLMKAASIPEVLARIPAGSQFLGSGVAAVAFRMPDGNVIRLQPAIAEWLNLKRGRRFHPTLLSTDRPKIPGVLPALGQHVAGHGSQAVHMETTPFSPNVSFENESDEHLAATSKLAALLWQNQYGLQDSHPGNLGMWQKEVVARDPGSIIHAGAPWLTTEDIEAHYAGLMGVYGELPELRAEWEARKKGNAMLAGRGRPIRGRGGRMRLRESGEASNFLQLADGGVRYRDDLQHFQSLVAAGFSNEESHRIMRRKPGDRPQPASMDPPSIAGIQLPQVPHRSMLDKIMDFAYMAEGGRMPRLAEGVKLPFQSKAKVETNWDTNPAVLHAALQSLLGAHVGIDDLASLVGAPEGATVKAGGYAGGKFWVNTYGPGFNNSRTFGKDEFGKPYIYNAGFFVKKAIQGEGLGKTIFGQQVANAQALGVAYLKTHAARSGKPPMAGYYTWPRFGYDQSIDEMADAGYAHSTAVMNRTKQRFPRAKSILDVFDAGGKEWWKQHGWDLFHMQFDLAHGSRSMETWQKYLAEKKHPKVSLPGMMASPLFGIGGRGIGALPKLEGGGVGAETPNWLQMIAAQNARMAAENPNDDRFKLRPAQTLAERLAKKTTREQDEHDAWLTLQVRLEHGRNRLRRRKEAVTELQLPGRETEFQAYLRSRQHHQEANLAGGPLGAPLFLGLAQGGHTSGGLRAIAGEAGPERFHSRGQDYLLTRPTLITMHPGDFVQPRGKRIEDLPQLARGGGMGTFSILPGPYTDRPQPVIITGPFPLLVRDARGGGTGGGGAGGGGGALSSKALVLNQSLDLAQKVIRAATAGIQYLTGVVNTLGDSTLSGSQKMRSLIESFPIFGQVFGAIRELGDALSGIPDKLRRITMAHEKDMASRAAFHGGAETFRGHLFETQSQLAKATTLQHAVLPAQGPTARGTYQEELLYKRSQELLPAREAVPVAQAEAHAAQVVHGGAVVLRQQAQERVASLERKLVLGQQRVNALKDGVSLPRYGVLVGDLSNSERSLAIKKELMGMEADAAALDREHQSLLTATNREKEAGVAIERAESGVRKANIELAKSELGVLQQKEQRLASQATTVGAMSEGQKRRALSIADQVERGGYDSLTLRQKETLRGFAPQYARKEDERIGEGSFVTERLKQVNIFERGALRETRQQFDQKQQEVRVAIKFDHERLAAGMTHAMERVTDILIAAAHDAAVYAARQRSIAQQIMAAGK